MYWHVLMRDQPRVLELAREAQARLAKFSGLHMTPPEWLHMTTLVAGPEGQFPGSSLQQMTALAAERLSTATSVTVRLGKILYHPQAIMLAVTPADSLTPFRQAALKATGMVTGVEQAPDAGGWTPHITICYSTADQPARPIIDALGTQLPGCEIEIKTLSLVIQRGAERLWDWTPVSAIEIPARVAAPDAPGCARNLSRSSPPFEAGSA